jgi:signal recognition particle GTPase
MTGQDAANTAKAFDDALPLTGVILTKTDGDARGGAALSIRQITGKPIKFLGVGEKTTALEPFHPDRVASRILGMGDVLSLVEEVQRKVDQDQAEKLAKKLKKGKGFDLEDFRDQLQQMQKHGRHGRPAGQAPRHGPDPRARQEPGQRQGGQADRHHQLHDPPGAAVPGHHQGLAQAAHRRRAPAPRCRTSTSCSSSSPRCRR